MNYEITIRDNKDETKDILRLLKGRFVYLLKKSPKGETITAGNFPGIISLSVVRKEEDETGYSVTVQGECEVCETSPMFSRGYLEKFRDENDREWLKNFAFKSLKEISPKMEIEVRSKDGEVEFENDVYFLKYIIGDINSYLPYGDEVKCWPDKNGEE